MGEREMLELAARAAGIELVTIDGALYFKDHALGNEWRPQHDDGQALRLAVKLGFTIRRFPLAVEVSTMEGAELAEEDILYDVFAATRLAIVRAAAEIGAQQE